MTSERSEGIDPDAPAGAHAAASPGSAPNEAAVVGKIGGIVGILLAAGSGSRFGSDKLMHPLPGGDAIAVRSARNLKAALPDCLAVVRPESTALAIALQGEGLEVVVCADAASGMGHSLAEAVRQRPDAAGYVVSLADMPFIAQSSIEAVRDALDSGARLAMPAWQGRRGHPVGFASMHRAALCKLAGDAGARHLIAAAMNDAPESLVIIDVDDPGIVRDIDTRADLD